jgi:hypothetical protein
MKVHYHVYKSPPLVPILSQTKPVHTATSYLKSNLILLSHLRLGLPSGRFPFGFLTKISPMRVICPPHLILLNLNILNILGEEQKL